jgi:hypothetical protein
LLFLRFAVCGLCVYAALFVFCGLRAIMGYV